jgi:hypothetical protein
MADLVTDVARYGSYSVNVLRHDGMRAAVADILGEPNEEINALITEAYLLGVMHGFAQGREKAEV